MSVSNDRFQHRAIVKHHDDRSVVEPNGAWFEKGRTSEKWKKLRLVLVDAKDIDHETLQQAQQPFNVGTIRIKPIGERLC